MKVGILGTRGIPNYHGGFEQFAEVFSVYLHKAGHEAYVYCSSIHPYQESSFEGVHLIHCKDPEDRLGTPGQFIYDWHCIQDARKRNFDVLLQLGYTSNSIWHWRLPKTPVILTNMDGLEWKRSKYSAPVRKFLKYAEKLAIKSSDVLIADSIGIQEYIGKTYKKESTYIPYGATVFEQPNKSILEIYQVEAFQYHMLIARMEPENSIEVILDGFVASGATTPFLVVGKNDVNDFGKHLTQKYASTPQIRFVGGIYDLEHLNNLRYYSHLYFHGHTVGGTNPSLLEAMASNALIVANDNLFNKAILGDDAFYFDTSESVAAIIQNSEPKEAATKKLTANILKIHELYNWETINQQYLTLLETAYGAHK